MSIWVDVILVDSEVVLVVEVVDAALVVVVEEEEVVVLVVEADELLDVFIPGVAVLLIRFSVAIIASFLSK